MDQFIQKTLDLLEIPEEKRRRIFARVQRKIQEQVLQGQEAVYREIIEAIELIPYTEKIALRLDEIQPRFKRTLHEVIPTKKPEQRGGIPLEEIALEYQPLLAKIQEILGTQNLEVLIGETIADQETIKERIAALRKRKQEKRQIIPPGRSLKRVYFTDDNQLILELGKREAGFDPVEMYHLNYRGVTRGQLFTIDPPLYLKLLREGHIDQVPFATKQPVRKRRPNNYDPEQEYLTKYPGITRTELKRRDTKLYDKLRNQGKIAIVPYKDPETFK